MDLDLTGFGDYLMDEGWKPFPKDKVARKIEKKRGENMMKADRQAHEMQATSNYRTKMTDPSKARQSRIGKDAAKTDDVMHKHFEKANQAKAKERKQDAKAEKAINKGKKKKYEKHDEKSYKHALEAHKHGKRGRGISSVAFTDRRSSNEDDRKQAEHNKKDKEARQKAKSALNRANLEKAYKDSPSMKESLNFTEFLEAIEGVEPIYQVEGEMPKCPRGHRWDMESKRCVPKRERDSVSPDGRKDNKPENGPSYNVWGRTGVNGDGYAWAEPNNWGGGDSGSGGSAGHV